MRWRVVVPLAVAAAVTGGAVFVVVDREPSPSHRNTTPAASTPLREPVLAALGTTALPPTKAAVSAAVAPALKAMPAGEIVAGAVVDVQTGATLWRRHAHAPQAPASTLKLLTATAALRSLGPDFRFTTSTSEVGHTLYLVGGGDPTLARTASPHDVPARYPKPATLADLARTTAMALTPGQPIRLRFDSSAWSSRELAQGWADNYFGEGDVTPPSALELDGGRLQPGEFDSPRTTDPAGQAADAFAALLHHDGVDVRGAVKAKVVPSTATQVAAVSSPPLSQLVQRMLTDSDNDLAEALGRAVAVHDGQPATFVGAATAVASQITALGVPPLELSLHDTSGLSHDDKIAPAALVAVLRAAAVGTAGALRPVLEGLPVGGFTGTLADRFRGKGADTGAGVVRAKTGSLTGVNTLAGVVVDGSGRLLAFAFLGSGTTETDAVQSGLDAAASALAQVT